jgi:hypothetical protein
LIFTFFLGHLGGVRRGFLPRYFSLAAALFVEVISAPCNAWRQIRRCFGLACEKTGKNLNLHQIQYQRKDDGGRKRRRDEPSRQAGHGNAGDRQR